MSIIITCKFKCNLQVSITRLECSTCKLKLEVERISNIDIVIMMEVFKIMFYNVSDVQIGLGKFNV